MKDYIKKHFPFIYGLIFKIKMVKKTRVIKQKVREEYIIFKNNYINSKIDINKIGYKIMLDVHSIEKAMTSKKARYFGIQKVKNIINNIKIYESNNWKQDFAYNLGNSVLNEYCSFYEKNNWTDRDEYKYVSDFIVNRKCKMKTGVYKIHKKDFIKDSNIDYGKFLSSRHSFREFSNRKISSDDVKKAILMTLKTPTACNRQMCKIYYVKSDDIKNKILKYNRGLTNFDNDSINVFIVTYDVSSLSMASELNQGMFNAGLVSMNFVNSLHSLGIGSCFTEYINNLSEEDEMKKLIRIPECEKIAVIVIAGYYPEESIIPCSVRKPIEEIYREI